MKNSYRTIKKATSQFRYAKDWKFERTYHTCPNSVAVCKEKSRYFIITNACCVKYRQNKGQVVKILR